MGASRVTQEALEILQSGISAARVTQDALEILRSGASAARVTQDALEILISAVSPPAAPTGLTAAAISATRVDLAWTDNATDELGFRIERSPAGAGTWAQIGTAAADATSFSDTTASASTAYDYRVFAYNAGGGGAASNTASATTPAANTAPTAGFSLSANLLTVAATSSATDAEDPDGVPQTIEYDWGDGSGYGAAASHTYAAAGTYTVTQRVTDSGGLQATTSHTISVRSNQAPMAAFSASVQPGRVVDFTNGSTDADADSLSYLWDFGDGATSTATNPSHAYAEFGSYTVTLTADDGFATNSVSRVVVVAKAPPDQPTLTISVSAYSVRWDGSAYHDADGDAHAATRFRLYAEDGTTLVWDSGWLDEAALTALGFTLTRYVRDTDAGAYLATIQYQSVDGAESAESAKVAVAVAATPAEATQIALAVWAPSADPTTYVTGTEGNAGLVRREPPAKATFTEGVAGFRQLEPRVHVTYIEALQIVRPRPPKPLVFAPDVVCELYLLQWQAVVDPMGRPITYRGDISADDGETWTALFAAQPQTSFLWDATDLTAGQTYRLRIIANNGVNDSAPAEFDVVYEPQASVGTGPLKVIVGAAGDSLYIDGIGAEDGAAPYVARLEYDPIAPAGVGGDALFTRAVVVLTNTAGATVRVTPILDGEALTDEAVDLVLAARERPRTARYEIMLTRPLDDAGGIEQGRAALRGTWLSMRLETVGMLSCGILIFESTEVEWAPLRETVANRLFTSIALTPRAPTPTHHLLVGTAGTDLLEAVSGYDDDSAAYAVSIETNAVAPGGASGECIFTALYLALDRSNTTDVGLVVTPVLDGDDLAPVALALAGTGGQVLSEVRKIPLSVPYVDAQGTEQGRYAPRGAWLAVRIESDPAAPLVDGDLAFLGAALEYRLVRETIKVVHG